MVRKDPNSGGSEADIAAQTAAVMDLRHGLNTAVDLVNRIELVRSQLDTIGRVVNDAAVRKAADEVARTFTDLEMTLIDLRLTGAQDGIRYAAKLVSRFGYLANGIAASDFRPTDQQLEVQKLLAERLRAAVAQFDGLVQKDLAGLNTLLRSRNIPHIVSGEAGRSGS